MLKVRVKDIPPEGKDLLLRLDGAWFVETMGDAEGSWSAATGEISLNLSRKDLEVLARGEIRAQVPVLCARCLDEAAVNVRASFATTFVAEGEPGSEGASDDPDLEVYDGEELDLQKLTRENLLLGLPMSSLCRPDCKGLCPQCGKELNLGPCGCPAPMGPLAEKLSKFQRTH